MPPQTPPDLRHLIVTGRSRSVSFTNPGSGPRAAREFPRRERGRHAAQLANAIVQIQQQADLIHEARAAAGVDDIGIVVEFASEPGYELKNASLENRRSGIQLLNVRYRLVRMPDGSEKPQEFATVRVPFGKLKWLAKIIEAYRTEQSRGGAPRHQALIEPIAQIRAAVLEAFWTEPHHMPAPGFSTAWEAWLHHGPKGDEASVVLEKFRNAAVRANARVVGEPIHLPEETVVLIMATREQLAGSLDLLDCLAELRAPAQTAAFLDGLSIVEQRAWVDDLLRRMTRPSADSNAVCLLDSGVNAGHPLLAPIIAPAGLQTYNVAWGIDDEGTGHGTQMAGLAAFGDLTIPLASNEPVNATHWIECVKAIKPTDPQPERLWGSIIRESIARIEEAAPLRKRVFSQQIAAQNTAVQGRPTSWSAVVDQLCAAATEEPREQRLILICAGNTEPTTIADYPAENQTGSIHDPAQSWNALTVGAFTEKDLLQENDRADWQVAAERGELAPTTSCSLVWEHQWPLKPDIVMEGGNKCVEPASGALDRSHSLETLTTNAQWRARLLTTADGTSAATAQAARFAAIIQQKYPTLWPETIRGLLVHSAEWRPKMLPRDRAAWSLNKGELRTVIRQFGFGVPNLDAALRCLRSSVTMIVQDEIKPFMKEAGAIKTDAMRFHDLPWPTQVLEELGAATVEMSVTLSYFIEPNPGPRLTSDRYRYGSCNLRFDVARPTESTEEFIARINAESRSDDFQNGGTSDSSNWMIGSDLRHRGSVHRDTWRGQAAQLASKGKIAVYPVNGWWRLRPHLNRFDSTIRYALIVSLRSPEQDVDLYTPIAVQVGVPVAINGISDS